jgi:hypothetical protein
MFERRRQEYPCVQLDNYSGSRMRCFKWRLLSPGILPDFQVTTHVPVVSLWQVIPILYAPRLNPAMFSNSFLHLGLKNLYRPYARDATSPITWLAI